MFDLLLLMYTLYILWLPRNQMTLVLHRLRAFFWRVQAPKFEEQTVSICPTQSPKASRASLGIQRSRLSFSSNPGGFCVFFSMQTRMRWRLFEICLNKGKNMFEMFFFKRGKNTLTVQFLLIEDSLFFFWCAFVWCRFDFSWHSGPGGVFLITFCWLEGESFHSAKLCPNHINLRLLWMFLMPDLLVSSFFSNDLKKKRPLTCGWVKKTPKNGHKNLRYRWKPIQLRLGLHKKNSDWWCEH